MQVTTAASVLSRIDALLDHPRSEQLIEIITGETDTSSAGYPYISDRSFQIFTEQVPHLYRNGGALLDWPAKLDQALERQKGIPPDELESIGRASKVLRTIVNTAGITAPPDLWILKHVLSAHSELGIRDHLLAHEVLDPDVYARDHRLNGRQLRADCRLLHSRGYVAKGDGDFLAPSNLAIRNVLEHAPEIPGAFKRNLVPSLARWFSGEVETDPDLDAWLTFSEEDLPTGSWVASQFDIELGYRVLPVVLGLRVLDITPSLREAVPTGDHIPNPTSSLMHLLELAGYTTGGVVTPLGARVFARGPGAFGIIGAYHPYLNNLTDILQRGTLGTWVNRAENVAASQDANRKTFSIANDRLDSFCADFGYSFRVFIEHAVGRGEAIRQRFERDGEEALQFIGADLENSAIDQAVRQQERGMLPSNLQFVRSADIGEPQRVISYLAGLGLQDVPTVMMVGNGFHEIREQTNEKMVDVFSQYEQAGYVLIFTEESALHDEALYRTAWNTYHAGFRYVHEMSGQGLRPAVDRGESQDRWSWRKCAELAGYRVLDEYGYRSRTIYPYKRPRHKNPAISVTYFCVPGQLARDLGVHETRKS